MSDFRDDELYKQQTTFNRTMYDPDDPRRYSQKRPNSAGYESMDEVTKTRKLQEQKIREFQIYQEKQRREAQQQFRDEYGEEIGREFFESKREQAARNTVDPRQHRFHQTQRLKKAYIRQAEQQKIITEHKEEQRQEPIKIQAAEAPVRTQTASTSVRTQTASTPVRTQTTRTPVRTQTASTPVRTQTASTPVRTQTASTSVRTQTASTPVRTEPSLGTQKIEIPVIPADREPARVVNNKTDGTPKQPSSEKEPDYDNDPRFIYDERRKKRNQKTKKEKSLKNTALVCLIIVTGVIILCLGLLLFYIK